MASFEMQGPDGKTYEVEAPDMQSAVTALQGIMRANSPTLAKQDENLAWSDVPAAALKNAPESAKNLASNIFQAVTHPIDTLGAIGDAAAGGLRAGAKRVLPAGVFNAIDSVDRPETTSRISGTAEAIGGHISDRYGSEDGLKRTLATDPVGAAADVAAVLTGAGGLVSRAPGFAGSTGRAVSRVGGAIDPISNAGRAVAAAARPVGRAAAEALGVTTGTGATPIVGAFNAGRQGSNTFLDHMRGYAPADDAVAMAERAVEGMGRERSANYNAGMTSTKASQEPINLAPINGAFHRTWQRFHHKGVPINAEATAKIQEMYAIYNQFREATGGNMVPADLDALKQAMRGVVDETKQGTRARVAADEIYRSIKRQIEREVPEYAAAMEDYARASDQIKEARRTLSVSDRASTDTTLRKLQSTQRNNVNTNYGTRARLLDELAGFEPELPNALAGQALNQISPRGLARLPAGGGAIYGASNLNPLALAALPATSPRVVGEVAYASGRAASGAEQIVNALLQRGVSPQRIANALMALQASGRYAASDE